jgi:signal transduction histidine kinase
MSLEPVEYKIAEIMTDVPEIIQHDCSYDEIIALFKKPDSSVVLVVDKNQELIGCIRHSDIFRASLSSTSQLVANQLMFKIHETVSPDSSHHEASRILLKSKLRFVPVVKNKKPIGIVWTDSSLAALSKAYRDKFDQWKDSQAKIDYRDEFLSILVHDLRSPLGSISACCDLIKMGAETLPKSYEGLLDAIKKNAGRCLHLAQDLLEFGKLNAGMNVELEIVEIHNVLDDIIHNLSILGESQYGVTIHRNWCGSIGIQIDRTRFHQIIDNLVVNAFKVTPRGKSITITTDLIDDFKRDNKALRIQITDQGPGIPKAKISEIFDKYSQLDNSDQSKNGVGLGLSIVAQFVRLHNGDIQVDGGGEQTGHGATFSIVLPNASILNQENMRGSNKDKKKILVVDDDEDVRDIIIDALDGKSFDIRTAEDGLEAFSLFLTWDPDLVITDMKMPHKNGIELIYDIKQANPNTPIILLSGALENFTPGEVQTTIKPDLYLPKPFKSAQLLHSTNELLQQSK